MHKYICVVLSLRECLKRLFGEHFPNEIIWLIILKFYGPIKINCGPNHTTLISNGVTYVWGENDQYQLDTGHNTNELSPQKLMVYEKLGDPPMEFSKMKCYYSHTIALTIRSELYVWGSNKNGQLGMGDYKYQRTPHKLLLSNIKKINGGSDYTISLTKLNEIYVWGKNSYGMLGLGDNHNQKYNSPQKLSLPDVNSIACGYLHVIALIKNSNKLYVWGTNKHGQLGLGNLEDYNKPVELFLPLPILKITCGLLYTIALSKCNKLFVWGNNMLGQLGLGDCTNRHTPQELTLNDIISIKCGEYHTIALTKQGDIYGWGYNNYGQSGDSRIRNILTPQKISLSKIMSISCGGYHSIAITTYNDTYIWGKNDFGQLGLGDGEHQNKPCRLNFQF